MSNRILLILLISLFSGVMYSQSSNERVEIGDIFVIADIENNDYKYINFPKANIIIKRGGLVNYKNVKGKKVEVTLIEEKNDGRMIATIKLASEKFFFNSHKYITVEIDEAINKKELLRI